jgi:CubicO group peptidase (beta-lactamase class C family)
VTDHPQAAGSASERRDRPVDRVREACGTLEPIFRRHAERHRVPGLAYGVVLDGELVFTAAIGVANVHTRAQVDADTVFRIASMTKSFAALAIVKLRDAGLLQLDDPVARHVPELARLAYPTADSAPLTVRQLLTMSAGWPKDDPWADRQLHLTDEEAGALYAAGASWAHPPGTAFEYSNFSYMILGRVVSNVTGMPALDYIEQHILRPLGLTATVWNAREIPGHRLAQGYRWQDGDWVEEPALPCGGDAATFGGLYSCVRDLARWIGLFQSSWPARDDPESASARRSSLREMQQTWRAAVPSARSESLGSRPLLEATGYGYGLFTHHDGTRQSVGHSGGLPGFGSHMRWVPTHGIGIVALANCTYAAAGIACREALGVLVERACLAPRPAPRAPALERARSSVIRLLARWDDALVDRLFAANFFLDHDRARWSREWTALTELHGTLRPEGGLEVATRASGSWRMTGEQGGCRIAIMLAPTVPPRIQKLEFTSVLPPTPALLTAATSVAALTARPRRRALQRVCRPAVRDSAWDQVRLAGLLCGPCRVGAVLEGDGATWMRVELIGPKQNAEMTVHVDAAGKLTGLAIAPTQG